MYRFIFDYRKVHCVYSFTTLGIRGNLFILAESLAGHSSSTAVAAQMFQLKINVALLLIISISASHLTATCTEVEGFRY